MDQCNDISAADPTQPIDAADPTDTTDMAARIALLEATITELREVAPPIATPSRRLLLRGAAMAAGGAVVGALAHSPSASAADNSPILIGNTSNTGTLPTQANCTGVTTTGTAFLFQAGNAELATTVSWNAAVSAVASNGTTRVGFYGRSDLGNGAVGVIGHSTVNFKSVGVMGMGVTGVIGTSTSGTGIGVMGRSSSAPGVHGDSMSGDGVEGVSDSGAGASATSASGPGVKAVSASGAGVDARSTSASAVKALSTGGAGVEATSTNYFGLIASGATGLAATGTNGAGILAIGGVGAVVAGSGYGLGVASAGGAALFLSASNGVTNRVPPPARTDLHYAGEIDIDANNALWLCTSNGTPGTWRKLAGPSTAGAFHPVVPARVYDSRTPAPGPAGELFTGQTRLVNVAARRDLTTGAGVENDYVPAGSTAITCNVTVVGTIGAGFLTINPGGITTINAATANWSQSDQILNNGVTLTLNAQRELTVIAGGGAGSGTHFVLDVTGYYL